MSDTLLKSVDQQMHAIRSSFHPVPSAPGILQDSTVILIVLAKYSIEHIGTKAMLLRFY